MTSITNSIKKSSSDLSLSSSDSYQSLSDLTVECCICLEEILNEDSYMPNCKHSWCKECNDQLNTNNINNCPVCKSPFNSILRNGRWKYTHNLLGGKWKWEAGSEDSKTTIRKKKVQQFMLNLGLSLSIGGLNINV